MRKLWWLVPVLVIAVYWMWKRPASLADQETETSQSSSAARPHPASSQVTNSPAPASVAATSTAEGSPSSATEAAASGGPVIRNEEDFRRAFAGDWSIGKGPDGRPQYIAGGPLPAAVTSADRALPLITRLAPFLGVEAEQLTAQPAAVTSETPDTKTIEAKQVVDGYEVFEGRVIVHARNRDGAVFIIDNLSRVVRPYSRQIVYSQDQARDLARAHYGTSVVDVSFERGPLLYAGETSTELAYVFTVKVRDPKTRVLRVVMSAASGKILDEIEVSHD